MGFTKRFPNEYLANSGNPGNLGKYSLFGDIFPVSITDDEGTRTYDKHADIHPIGANIECLMSWLNYCAEYHKWNDTIENSTTTITVTPESGFTFFRKSGEAITPEVNSFNFNYYYSGIETSQLRHQSWTYYDFWEQLYDCMDFAYDKITGSIDYPHDFDKHWEGQSGLLGYTESGEAISGIVNSGIFYDDMQLSGELYRNTKMPAEVYGKLLLHNQYHEDWTVNNMSVSYDLSSYSNIEISSNNDIIPEGFPLTGRPYEFSRILGYRFDENGDRALNFDYFPANLDKRNSGVLDDLTNIERSLVGSDDPLMNYDIGYYDSYDYHINFYGNVQNPYVSEGTSTTILIEGRRLTQPGFTTWPIADELGIYNIEPPNLHFSSFEYGDEPDENGDLPTIITGTYYGSKTPLLHKAISKVTGLDNVQFRGYLNDNEFVLPLGIDFQFLKKYSYKAISFKKFIGSGNLYEVDGVRTNVPELNYNNSGDIQWKYLIASNTVSNEYLMSNCQPADDFYEVFNIKGSGEDQYLYLVAAPTQDYIESGEITNNAYLKYLSVTDSLGYGPDPFEYDWRNHFLLDPYSGENYTVNGPDFEDFVDDAEYYMNGEFYDIRAKPPEKRDLFLAGYHWSEYMPDDIPINDFPNTTSRDLPVSYTTLYFNPQTPAFFYEGVHESGEIYDFANLNEIEDSEEFNYLISDKVIIPVSR